MNTPLSLIIQPLTVDAFAPFGDVIDTGNRDSFFINQGTTERFHALAQVQLLDDSSSAEIGSTRAIISIFRAQPRLLPFEIKMMEKHPFGSQFFMPLSKLPYLVVVATGSDVPNELHAFYAEAHQGVNYHAGIWHHPLIALNQSSDFLVIDRQGGGINCIEYPLQQTAWLILDTHLS